MKKSKKTEKKPIQMLTFFAIISIIAMLLMVVFSQGDLLTGDAVKRRDPSRWEKVDNKQTTKSTASSIATSSTTTTKKSTRSGSADSALVGSWRPYSEAIYYDSGTNNIITPVSRYLELKSDGTWAFGSSTGTWSVSSLRSKDWSSWGISSYGPTRKLVLNNWNKGTAAGPIEESGHVDFIWVVYRYESASLGPATIWIKFGK